MSSPSFLLMQAFLRPLFSPPSNRRTSTSSARPPLFPSLRRYNEAMPNTHDILFGADPTERIVAVEIDRDRAIVYRRTNTAVAREEVPFAPWLLAPDRLDLPGSEWQEMEGDGYAWLARF